MATVHSVVFHSVFSYELAFISPSNRCLEKNANPPAVQHCTQAHVNGTPKECGSGREIGPSPKHSLQWYSQYCGLNIEDEIHFQIFHQLEATVLITADRLAQ